MTNEQLNALNESLNTLNTRLAVIQAMTFAPGDAVLVHGKLANALCLGFTEEGKPEA